MAWVGDLDAYRKSPDGGVSHFHLIFGVPDDVRRRDHGALLIGNPARALQATIDEDFDGGLFGFGDCFCCWGGKGRECDGDNGCLAEKYGGLKHHRESIGGQNESTEEICDLSRRLLTWGRSAWRVEPLRVPVASG